MTERPARQRLPADLPLFTHADRARAVPDPARRGHARRQVGCVLALGVCAAVGLTILVPPTPRLVWNASASAPIGLYAVSPHAALSRGDMVVAWAPHDARALAARRHYLPANVPLVKRVRGVDGDRICARGAIVTVNGRAAAIRRARDAAGRPLPWWTGCTTLDRGALLLLNDAAASFDGRYFGATRRTHVIGRATPLWLR